MTKRFLLLVLLIGVVITRFPNEAEARYASIIVHENTGKVMYSRNADQKLYPASLTKIMTLYLLFEALENGEVSMRTRMKVSKVAAGRSPSKLGLKIGSTITARNAMMALVTKSANDAATVIAEHLGGTEREFAKKMTRKARSLGMSRTTFRNASGLPHSAQQSTARDMAKLAIAIRLDFPQYYDVFKTQSFEWGGRKFKNHNKLLGQYKGTDGIKTGYIRASGFNLVASVERQGVRLVGVVFGGRTGASRDKHMIHLLNKQFNRVPEYTQAAILPPKQSSVIASLAPPPPKPAALALKRKQDNDDKTNKTLVASIVPTRPSLDDPIPADPPKIADWEIQVGSYENRSNAHRAARDARGVAIPILSMQPAVLRQVRYGTLMLWQVRFKGFDEKVARQACLQLFTEGLPCVAVPKLQQSS